MSGYYSGVNRSLLNRLPTDARLALEVGCGTGAFGHAYKGLNPHAAYLGVELFQAAAAEARGQLDRVVVGDIETDETLAALDAALAGAQVDLLVFGDVLEHLRDPWAVLARLRERAAPGAACVACIPNVAHWSLVLGQAAGRWDYADSGLLDRTHLRFFTLASAAAMFRQAGWSVVDASSRVIDPERTEAVLKDLEPMAPALRTDAATLRRNLSAFQWVIRAANPPPAA